MSNYKIREQKVNYLSRLNSGTGERFIVLSANSVKCGRSMTPNDKSHRY